MSYPQQEQRNTLAGSPAPTEAVLRALCTQIQSRIDTIGDRIANIDTSIERMLNPRPVNAVNENKKDANTAPNTLESELQSILQRLSTLSDHAIDTAQELCRAV